MEKLQRVENIIITRIITEKYTYELRWGTNRYTGDNPEEYELTKITNSNKQRRRLYDYKLVYKKNDKDEMSIKVVDTNFSSDEYYEIMNPLLSIT